MLRGSWINLLLVFIPVSLTLSVLRAPAVLVFVVSALAIIPLAALIGLATEATTEHTGPGIGGFLTATFGNATELIIALFAVSQGLYEVVKASLTGSIIGNVLLVLGMSMLVGGWGREQQRFNRTAAGAGTAMLMLAVTGLVMPAMYDLVVVGTLERPSLAVHNRTVASLSLLTAIVLLVIYALSLIFSLVTHRELFAAVGREEAPAPRYRLSSAVTLLAVATALIAVEAETLVSSIAATTAVLGLTELFVGVVIVAIIGNAAEQFTAVLVAWRGQMELAFRIALGASTQIALFVAPVLVLASLGLGPQQMDLVFNPFEIVAVFLAVLSVAIVSLDGESNWFEGIELVAVYLLLAIAFFFVPTS